MPKKNTVSEDQVTRAIHRPIFGFLAETGRLTEEHLTDRKGLSKLIRKHIKLTTRKAKWGVSIEQDFIDQAHENWLNDKKQIAIVLFCVAVEHNLNGFYRNVFESKGVKEGEITTIIRSTNLEGKLTWLLNLSGVERLNPKTTKGISKLFEIRNSIIHFKSVKTNWIDLDDSHARIEKEIKSLGKISLKRNHQIIGQLLINILAEIKPWRIIANRAHSIYFDDHDPNYKTKSSG